jgi:hypothetical protein
MCPLLYQMLTFKLGPIKKVSTLLAAAFKVAALNYTSTQLLATACLQALLLLLSGWLGLSLSLSICPLTDFPIVIAFGPVMLFFPPSFDIRLRKRFDKKFHLKIKLHCFSSICHVEMNMHQHLYFTLLTLFL